MNGHNWIGEIGEIGEIGDIGQTIDKGEPRVNLTHDALELARLR